MIDPLIRVERELKTAEEFFQLAKNASSPFMRAYCRRIAERYLCESKSLKEDRQCTTTAALSPAQFCFGMTLFERNEISDHAI